MRAKKKLPTDIKVSWTILTDATLEKRKRMKNQK